MEILEILKSAKDEIYLDDLEFFKTELETGDYSEAYIAECKQQIKLVKKWICGEEERASQIEEGNSSTKQTNTSLVMDIYSIAPAAANPVVATMSPEEMIFSNIKSIRESKSYKSKFKKYVRDCADINATFVDRHYTFFLQWEIDAITSVRQLGEAFLEKYFGALDKEKISRYQCFSESFFMKHYSQLDVVIVLNKGKNEWRKKENRSKQLDVFLRLKGVRL